MSVPVRARRQPSLPAFLDGWAARVGLVLAVIVLAIALLGPLTPGSPTALSGAPYSLPSADQPLGTDFLGRSVLTRVLHGGLSVVLLASIATLVGYALGITVGLVAGYSRSALDAVLMRAMDILLAFPPILFLLVLATGAGASPVAVVAGIAVVQMPGVARVIRAATLETSVRGYVEAAVARGESTARILRREILPNIVNTVVADGGPRFTISILLVAGLNFLGLGLRPPTPDWAVMIAENRSGLTINPWSVVAPAVLIAVLTVGVNLVADALARSRGVSVDPETIPR